MEQRKEAGDKNEEEKKGKSTKPLRNCRAQRLLFIEAGLKQKNDRHRLCTWSTTVLTVTQTFPIVCILIHFWYKFFSSHSRDRFCIFFSTTFSQPYTFKTTFLNPITCLTYSYKLYHFFTT